MREELGISEQEYLTILTELGVEDPDLLDLIRSVPVKINCVYKVSVNAFGEWLVVNEDGGQKG